MADLRPAPRAAVEDARTASGWDHTRLNAALVGDLASRGVFVETIDAEVVSRPSGPSGELEEWLVITWSLPGDTQGIAIPLRFMRASQRVDRGDATSALPDLELVVREVPDVGLYRFVLGKAYIQLGRLDDAEEQLLAAVSLEPHNTAGLTTLGNLYAQRGDDRRAVPFYERSLALKRSVWTLSSLAAALLRLREVLPAIALLREATAQDPAHAPSQYSLGFALCATGAPEVMGEAVAALRRALDALGERERDPDLWDSCEKLIALASKRDGQGEDRNQRAP